MNRKNLQNEFGEGYFLPGIYYLLKKNSGIVETFCVWPEHIPTVLPKVDFVMIQKRFKKFFRTKEESGLISYSDLMTELGDHFEDLEHFKIIHKKEASEISAAFNQLGPLSDLNKYGDVIGIDTIVNCKVD